MEKKWSLSRTARKLHRSKTWVQKWRQRYKTLGVQGLYDLQRSGRPSLLDGSKEIDFIERLQLGPQKQDAVSVFRGKVIKEILSLEFCCKYSLSGVYNLLRRLNFKRIRPRPRHEKNDPSVMKHWQRSTLPLAVAKAQLSHPDKILEIWFQDEMRYGNKTRVVAAWKQAGTQWTQTKQNGFSNCYVYGAVNSVTGDHVGFVYPHCSTEAMNVHIELISQAVDENKHILLIVDQAGWHSKSSQLKVPQNITLLDLPPYSPELNPVERLWLWIKENYLSNVVINREHNLVDIGCQAWNQLSKERVKSICNTDYIAFTNFL